jgi:quercetin dioxygenase-like cupin family protein
LNPTTLQTIHPEQGNPLQFGDVQMNRLVGAADLPSGIAVQEWTVAPHFLGAPPHRHTHEDELFLVLEGEMTVMEEESVRTAAAGSYVLLPRSRLHGFWNAGDVPARMLVLLTPGGLEDYFPKAAQHAHDLAAVMRTSAAYGMEFRMDLVPGIMEKYNLKSTIPAPPAPVG